MSFAPANYDSGGSTNFWTLKAGERGETSHFIARILPAFGKAGTQGSPTYGKFIQYYAQHFGYRGQSSRPGGDPVARPFGCIREKDRKTDMVRVECPECVLREGIEAKRDKLKEQLKTEGKTDEEIKLGLKKYNDWLKEHNRDSKYYVAAMNQKREFGILKLPWEAQDKMKKRIKEILAEEKVDATRADQGVWFDFKRSGESFTTTSYDVDPVYDKTAGDGGRWYKTLKVEPLSIEEQNRAEAQLPSLEDIPHILTEEQIRRLVACSGDPSEVDAIMGVAQKRGTQERAARNLPEPTPKAAAPVPVEQPAAARTVAATSAPVPIAAAAAPVDDEEAALERQLAAARARKAAAASAAAPPLVTTQAASAPVVTSQAPQGATPGGSAAQFLVDFGFKG